jgi:integrase
MDDEVNETLIRDLATGDFLDNQRNLALIGGTGTGKTHLAVSIVRACIRNGRRGRFFNVVDLVNKLDAERLHVSTRQYARLVRECVSSIGLDPTSYRTHAMRRTKVAHIYRKTGNLRAVQLLLGHTKMDSTVRYLGVELQDALAIAEAVEI